MESQNRSDYRQQECKNPSRAWGPGSEAVHQSGLELVLSQEHKGKRDVRRSGAAAALGTWQQVKGTLVMEHPASLGS